MAEAGNAFPVLVNRIARSVGMTISPRMNRNHRVMTVVKNILPEMVEMGNCPGSMLLQMGSENSVLPGAVVMLDGSASSEALLPFVSGVCRREVASLHMMAPAKMRYVADIPGEKYLRVLVNTMKEQSLHVTGELVEGDLFSECVRAAKAQGGMLAVCVADADGPRKEYFTKKRLEPIRDMLVLYHAPARCH